MDGSIYGKKNKEGDNQLQRRRGNRGGEAPYWEASCIVKTISRVVFPFILLVGIYMAIHGHLSPGGAFVAGTIFATGFALFAIVYKEGDVEYEITLNDLFGKREIAGIILIILILNLAYVFRGSLIQSQTFLNLWSGGFTPFLNLAGYFLIMGALVVIVYSLVRE